MPIRQLHQQPPTDGLPTFPFAAVSTAEPTGEHGPMAERRLKTTFTTLHVANSRTIVFFLGRMAD